MSRKQTRRKKITVTLLAAQMTLLLPCAASSRAADDATASAPPSGAAAVAAVPTPAAYRIEPDDVLEVVVLGETDLPRTITVLPDGTITYPYVGQVKAAGLTVRELAARITTGLKTQILRPQVTVLVSRRGDRSVSVLGAVKTPGKTLIQAGWRVLDVLAATGGITVARPEWTTAMLVRGGGKESQSIDLVRLLTAADPEQNPPVKPGDILLVSEREVAQTQVQVLGEVLKQGVIAVPSDGSVLAALASAGGATPQAALGKVVIRRGSETVPVDLNALLKEGATDPGPRLQPGDTLVVPKNTRRFAALGGVTRPGAIDYPEGRTLDLISALSLAGGQTPEADLKNVSRLRFREGGGGKPETVTVNVWEMLRKGDMSRNIPIEPGDVLFVPDKTTSRTGLGFITGILPALGWILR